jgi:hypothetical protein
MSDAVVEIRDYRADASQPPHADEARITEKVAEIAASRAVIEQAKGMLAAVYGLDGEAAFAVLRWRSQVTNSKLRAIAAQLIVDFREVSSTRLPSRSTYDKLLLSVHERVTPAGMKAVY